MENLTENQLEDFCNCKYHECRGCSNILICRDGNGYSTLVNELQRVKVEMDKYRFAIETLKGAGHVVGKDKSKDKGKEIADGWVQESIDTLPCSERLPSPMWD